MIFTLAVLSASAKAQATVPEVRLDIEQIMTESLILDGVSLTLEQRPDLSVHSSGTIDSLTLRHSDDRLDSITFSCVDQVMTAALVSCESATLAFRSAYWPGELSGELSYRLETASDTLSFSMQLPLADGNLDIRGDGTVTRLDVSVAADKLSLAKLTTVFAGGLLEPAETIAGELSFETGFTVADQIDVHQTEFVISSVDSDINQSRYATASVNSTGNLSYEAVPGGHRIGVEMSFPSGEVLAGPLYLNLSDIPSLAFTGVVVLDQQLSVRQVDGRFTDSDALSVSARAKFSSDGSMTASALELEKMIFPASFDRYLASLLQPYGWDGLQIEGELQAAISLTEQALQRLTIGLTDITIVDERDRVDVSLLEGLVDYDAQGDSSDSWLSWNDVRLYEIPFSSSRADFFAGGRQFQLLKTLELPLFDGLLRVSELNVNDMRTEQMSVDFLGRIEPISMQLITRALGWPEFSGSLSGEIPTVSVRGDRISVGGAIELAVFDGRVVIDQLEIERMFGVLPSFSADIDFNAIDLELLTGTFSFGKIEGRLDGSMQGLRMLDWSPVAFDLKLMTPEEDSGKRRISQRAVNNISSIGGGIAALSNSVLKIFDDFAYSRIGISCRLVNHVCYMGGIGRSDQGYYLVKGAGLPRINIIGYSGVVDWPQLVARLAAATKTTSVTVD